MPPIRFSTEISVSASLPDTTVTVAPPDAFSVTFRPDVA
jgi:hypothetical protein